MNLPVTSIVHRYHLFNLYCTSSPLQQTTSEHDDHFKDNKMLSFRRETALQGALAWAKSGRLELADYFVGRYRSIFNHLT